MSVSTVSDKPKFLIGSNDRVFKTLVNSGEKGKEQGIEQNKLDNARKMKEKGFNIKDIQNITGLSKEKIQKL